MGNIYDITTRAASQYYFERKPPYIEESLQRAMGEEIKVQWALQKREIELKKVKEAYSVAKNNNDNRDEVPTYEGPLQKEDISRILKEVLKKVPDFPYLSDKEKDLIVSDVVTGKWDDIIFEKAEK